MIGVIYTLPVKKTNIKPNLRIIEALSAKTVGIGRISTTRSVAMFGTLEDL